MTGNTKSEVQEGTKSGAKVSVEWRFPLSGIALVLRRSLRGRSVWRDILWAAVIVCGQLAVGAFLQAKWAPANFYNGGAPGFLLRWLTLGSLGAVFVMLPLAAVLGALAAPAVEEIESVQSALLTRLSAFDIGVGRSLASLSPLGWALLISFGFWTVAQAILHFVPGAGYGFAPILCVHFVLGAAVWMIGSIAYLSALRLPHPGGKSRSEGRSGRSWGRGTGSALFWTVFCLTLLFLVNPQIRAAKNPQRLIEGTLLLNPAAAVATSLDLDILRTEWLYERTEALEYLFVYPNPLGSASLFSLLGVTAQVFAALVLRRSYR